MSRTSLHIISSGDIEMYDDVSTPLNFNIADVRNPDKRDANYSKTIKIPGTKVNNLLLGNIFNINISTGVFNPNAKVMVQLLIDNEDQITGYMRLVNIIIKDDYLVEYEVVISGNVGNIFNGLGNSELTDLDFTEFDHTYNYATQIASWTNTYNNGYCYPFIDYGFDNNLASVSVNHLLPSIFLRTYIDKIVRSQGYTYTSTFLDSTFAKNLIIPSNAGTLTLSDAQIALRLFEAQQTVQTSGTITSTFNATLGVYENSSPEQNIVYNNEISDVSGQYNPATGVWTIGTSGYYNIAANANMVLNFSGTPAAMNGVYNIKKSTNAGATYTPLSQTLQTAFSGSQTIYVGVSNVFLNVGDLIKITSAIGNSTSVLNASAGYTVNGGTFKNTLVNSGLIEGDTLLLNQAVPKNIKQKDFLLSVIKHFNLYLDVDKNNDKNLLIETRDDFYSSGTTVDLSTKLDNNMPIEYRPMGDLDYKEFLYSYTDDSDYFNKKYSDTYGETYGRSRFITENELLTNVNETKVIFSPTPLVGDNSSDRVIPRIWSVDSSNQVSAKAFNIRILYLGGVKTSNVPYTYVSSTGTTTLTQYLYAGHVDDTQNPTLDLNFGVPREIFYNTSLYTDNNSFNRFFRKQIEEITDRDSKIVTAYFYLRPSDVRLIDFRNQFYFENQYFRLNKIYDYDPLRHETTRCEFIKIKDANTFIATSHSMLGGYPQAFGVAHDNFPIFSNWNADTINNVVLSGQARSMIGGTGNTFNDNLRSAIVQGNSNVIGNSTGVALLGSSSGDIIDSGLEGVVMINTHDTHITSGDITLINHIPFPSITPLYSGIKNISANYNITVLDGTLLVTTGASNITINLTYTLQQYAKQWVGFEYLGTPYSVFYTKIVTIKKVDAGAGTVIIDPAGGATIDGSLTKVLSFQYEKVTIQYDGVNWHIIG